ncbi:Aerobic glycerol-3-phosphate dehydrogenase [Rhynchospora pubera]|uniref:Aerobic glycerol-3-phosphate dehydrogenase n=1 Tax=Rhynchospora pubera TaxID=906938 RepID=A0AAV8FYS0_9POAL|nr:Aerobic glycerol-3-phosphate dehydrogenase [Rhynchospora pubera]
MTTGSRVLNEVRTWKELFHRRIGSSATKSLSLSLSVLLFRRRRTRLERGGSMASRAALASMARVALADTPAARIVPRRGMASAEGHHGPAKVNIWEDPLSPSKWKEEHFVLASLSAWGLVIYGGSKAFGGGKKEKPESKQEEATVKAGH